MTTIQIGVVGYGYWGPNLVRNYMETPDAQVLTVSDLEPDRLQLVKIRYPTIETTTRYEEIIANKSLDAIVIATPVSTHFEMALQALRAGKHVLVPSPTGLTPTWSRSRAWPKGSGCRSCGTPPISRHSDRPRWAARSSRRPWRPS